jgi:lipid-binding SYLF domain-containing protein
MKTKVIGLMMATVAMRALCADKAELDQRIHTLTSRFEAMQQQQDKMIPPDRLANAHGIVLVDPAKGGVALVKDSKSGEWSPAAFVRADPASLGAQAGAEPGFSIVLLMDPGATMMLTGASGEYGSEAVPTRADPPGVSPAAKQQHSVLVFDENRGLNSGATIKPGAITPDNEANQAYYDKPVSLKEILFDKQVKPAEPSKELAAKITGFSKNSKL